MDENYNYRIIFVNDPDKHHRYISYEQVKKLVSEHFPKNLIAYRIVTNFPDLIVSNVLHGFTILLNNEDELIFTDPVYAVRSIEDYLEHNPSMEFRFRVQKVGFTSIKDMHKKTNFKEEFCFDMNIKEVVNQNDEKVVSGLLKKRSSVKKKKKFKSEKDKNLVFTPEEEYKSVSTLVFKDKKTIDPGIFSKRMVRQAEGGMRFGDRIINLGTIDRISDEGNEVQLSSSNQRRIDVKNFQIETTSRNNQQSLRKFRKDSNNRENDENTDELGVNYSNDHAAEDVKFNKIRESEPVVIRKVGMDENGVGIAPEPTKDEKETDELFNGFLASLKNESTVKSKKKRKRKEKDILYLFKTLHAKDNFSDKN